LDMQDTSIILSEKMPIMAIRGITAFPDMVINFEVDRPRSLAALNAAYSGDRRIFLTAQRDVLADNPTTEDLYRVGTICVLRQFIRVPHGGMRVMLEGQHRAKLLEVTEEGKVPRAEVAILPTHAPKRRTARVDAQMRKAVEQYEEHCMLTGNAVPETLISLSLREDPGYVADYITQNIALRHTEKQQVLELLDPVRRLQLVNSILAREIEVLRIERGITEKLHEQMSGMHRDNVLREQLRIIQSELGMDDNDELQNYRDRILALHLAENVEEKLLKEVDRLAKQPFGSAESSVIRSYLDLCLELPWNKQTKERLNVAAARKILDHDHFGMEKVKERILEYLAVKQLTPELKGSILCLVGPPGVGKTSVAISIARATGRKLARLSLGGVHDEAEIRGHRKTYVGAMPGRIISAVNQAGTRNPLMLLDEIDKLGSDYRGDPSSALLEALDPEQNGTFRDNYLEIPFDLSQVLFITTANTTATIPTPLLDRMEVIELGSYTDEEKLQIARRYLLPKQRKKHGLSGRQLTVGDDVIREIIAGYTRESGVRQLERELGSVCRKTAAKIVDEQKQSITLRSSMLEEFLGVRKYRAETLSGSDRIGVVTGLAWTAVGGVTMEVEAVSLPGSGRIVLTGNLGEVMKESAQAAVSYIRSRAGRLGIDPDFYKNNDLHIHFPESAVPKDGPSAGITIAIAVISALTGIPVRRDVAMTGEISISGRILPIGGLKEKTMAALRAGIRTVIIPEENARDLEEIDQTVRRALQFVTASHLDNILDVALTSVPAPAEATAQKPAPEPIPDPVLPVLPPDSPHGGVSIRQ